MYRSNVIAVVALFFVVASVDAHVISVNFNGGDGNTTTQNGPAVTGAAGVISVSNWNNVPGIAGAGLPLVNYLGVGAGTLGFNSPNVYGATPTGGGVSGGAGDIAMMTGYLDNFGNGGTFATVTGLGAPFTTAGYYVLVYQNGDSNGSFGYTGFDGTVTDTRYGLQTGGNGGNYPLVGGINGYIGSTSTNSAGPASAANYVVLSGFNGSTFTLTGAGGSTGDGRPRIDGFQIFAVPEPTSLTLFGLGILVFAAARRRVTNGDNQLR